MGFALLVAASAVLFIWYLQVLIGPWFKNLFGGKSVDEKTADILKRRESSRSHTAREARYAAQEDPQFSVESVVTRGDLIAVLLRCERGRAFDAQLVDTDAQIQPDSFGQGDEVQVLLTEPGSRTISSTVSSTSRSTIELSLTCENPPGNNRNYLMTVDLAGEVVTMVDTFGTD